MGEQLARQIKTECQLTEKLQKTPFLSIGQALGAPWEAAMRYLVWVLAQQAFRTIMEPKEPLVGLVPDLPTTKEQQATSSAHHLDKTTTATSMTTQWVEVPNLADEINFSLQSPDTYMRLDGSLWIFV